MSNYKAKAGAQVSRTYNAIKVGTPRSKSFWIITLIAIAAIGVGIYFAFRPKAAVKSIPTVEVQTVTTDNVNIYGEYVGRIRAQQFVEIHPASRRRLSGL